MGFYEQHITIRGVRSAHNSLQDRLDLAKWNYLRERIDALIQSEDFSSLRIDVDGPSDGPR